MSQQTTIRTKVSAALCAGILLVFAIPTLHAETVITTDTTLQADLFDNVVIAADDVTLDCNGFAIVNPIPQGPPRVGIDISSRKGVVIKNGTVSGFFKGIRAEASKFSLSDMLIDDSVFAGLEAADNSNVSVSGSLTLRGSAVFAAFINNNTSVKMVAANVLIEENTAGFQLSVNSSVFVDAFPPTPPTTITAQHNDSFGLTITSNSHMFLFGAVTVVTSQNGSNGISIFTKSGIELDNGPSITAEDNTANGILLEDSALNMFNMPGQPGSSLVLNRNGASGVSVGKASVLDMGSDATILAGHNGVGMSVDNKSVVTVIGSTLDDNGKDVTLSFGSTGDFQGNTIGRLTCDRTVLIRGDERCRGRRNHGDDDDD